MKKDRFTWVLLLSLLLGCHKGYVALWTDPADTPAQVFPWPVAALPLQDQAALFRGIPVESMAQLNQLLEDYLS